MSEIHLYNTKSRSIEAFSPIHEGKATLYHCGPTVYNYAHIGNMRAYVFADILRRTLEWNNIEVKQIINITDVGHLVSDGDEGEDKMAVGAARENLPIEQIISLYTNAFLDDSDSLNIKRAHEYPRATLHIPEQIELIKVLEAKGYTYKTSDGLYFDTTKFPEYANFAHLNVEGLSGGARVDIGEKKSITDFALWKFYSGEGKREQEWESPWGAGFPGWHIECSAMAMKYLGKTLDVHTGGVDHINIHHTNEIAQSECATGLPFANIWMHTAFMNVDNQKMSKSLGNTYRISDLATHGISPLGYRYWLLTSHYRTQVNFTFEAALAAETGLARLKAKILGLKVKHEDDGARINIGAVQRAREFANDDLNTAKVIALLFELLSAESTLRDEEKYFTILEIDKLLGLGLDAISDHGFIVLAPADFEYSNLVEQRRIAREEKNWAEADRLRDELLILGYVVKDTPTGPQITEK